MGLRSRVIHLAFSQPHLRPHLLPLVNKRRLHVLAGDKGSGPTDISFPRDEWPAVQERLRDEEEVWTTRVDNEFDRYKLGGFLKTPWGAYVQVVEVRKILTLGDHPFFRELTEDQRELLSGYPRFDVLRLQALGNDVAH